MNDDYSVDNCGFWAEVQYYFSNDVRTGYGSSEDYGNGVK